jgi:hypothetical protein
VTCRNCDNAPSFEGCDECKECMVSLMLGHPDEMELLRRVHAGTQWLLEVEKEWARQTSAIAHFARAVA